MLKESRNDPQNGRANQPAAFQGCIGLVNYYHMPTTGPEQPMFVWTESMQVVNASTHALAMVGKEDTSRKPEPSRLPTGEPTTASEQDADPLDCHFSLTDDREMSECFQHLPAEECCLNLPEDSAVDNPWTSRPLRSSKMLTKNFNKQQQSMLINTHARVFVE